VYYTQKITHNDKSALHNMLMYSKNYLDAGVAAITQAYMKVNWVLYSAIRLLRVYIYAWVFVCKQQRKNLHQRTYHVAVPGRTDCCDERSRNVAPAAEGSFLLLQDDRGAGATYTVSLFDSDQLCRLSFSTFRRHWKYEAGGISLVSMTAHVVGD
jgi:hypothetical protein